MDGNKEIVSYREEITQAKKLSNFFRKIVNSGTCLSSPLIAFPNLLQNTPELVNRFGLADSPDLINASLRLGAGGVTLVAAHFVSKYADADEETKAPSWGELLNIPKAIKKYPQRTAYLIAGGTFNLMAGARGIKGYMALEHGENLKQSFVGHPYTDMSLALVSSLTGVGMVLMAKTDLEESKVKRKVANSLLYVGAAINTAEGFNSAVLNGQPEYSATLAAGVFGFGQAYFVSKLEKYGRMEKATIAEASKATEVESIVLETKSKENDKGRQ